MRMVKNRMGNNVDHSIKDCSENLWMKSENLDTCPPFFKILLPWNIIHQLCNSISFTVNSSVIQGNVESTSIREKRNHQNSEFYDTQ